MASASIEAKKKALQALISAMRKRINKGQDAPVALTEAKAPAPSKEGRETKKEAPKRTELQDKIVEFLGRKKPQVEVSKSRNVVAGIPSRPVPAEKPAGPPPKKMGRPARKA